MERHAAAGALSFPPAAIGGRFAIGLAAAGDDEEIRRLLRATPLKGEISLSLEREPDAALASAVDGDLHDTIVARDRGGNLAAIAGRSVRLRYLNGRPARVGYLGLLRVAPPFRRQRGLLQAGFEFCRGLHTRGRPELYFASIVAENIEGRRLLERGLPGWPRFDAMDRVRTLAIPARGGWRGRREALELVDGTRAPLEQVVACLARNGPRRQLTPCWTADDLRSAVRTRGLEAADLVAAIRRGEVVGCAACWDQRAFKQVVVRGYSPRLARWRGLVNLTAPLFGHPRLPPVGSALSSAYVSHAAVDGDDAAVLAALIRACCRRARDKGLDYVVVALSTASPELPRIERAFRHRRVDSVIYRVCWPDGTGADHAPDRRPSQPDMATL